MRMKTMMLKSMSAVRQFFFLRITITAVVCFFTNVPLSAQERGGLHGRVVNEKGNPLSYANVALMKKDSSLVAGTLADSNGYFRLSIPAPGRYFLRLTSIGLNEVQSDPFDVSVSEYSKDFGTVMLKVDAKALQGVTVEALRPTITQLADRMVVGIEGSSLSSGHTAFSVLSRAPGVFIDQDGNIQLNGRAGVLVMINNKQTYLSAKDLRNLLESMPAENIKNLELITNPSSRFDAEGTSGILNINLKKNMVQGINGSLDAGVLLNEGEPGFSLGTSINHKSGDWNSYISLNLARRVGGRQATFTRLFLGDIQNTYFDQVATGHNLNYGPPSIRLGTDYDIDSNHTVGTLFTYIRNTGKSEFLSETLLGHEPKKPLQFIEANNYATNTFTSLRTNLHYTGMLDSLGSVISADLDYVRITNRGESNFYNYYTNLSSAQTTTDFLYTHTPNGYDIYSAKMDYIRHLSKTHKFEAGLKASHVSADNDFRFYFNNNGLIPDPLRTNHFKYRENIYAAYLNWNGRLSKKLTMQAGLRAENTVSADVLLTTGEENERNYLDLFPSLFVQQKVSDDYGINYSYSRRITRPGYGRLNPFRFYRDPYTWEVGNPYLKPEYTHAFSVSQSLKKMYQITLNYLLYRDIMAELPVLDADKAITTYTTGNVDNGFYVGMTAVAPLKIRKGWDTQNTLSLSYNKLSILVDNNELVNDRVTYFIQSNHTMLLPWDIRSDVAIWYRGPAASGLYMIDPMWRADIGLRKSVWKKKVDLSLNASDIFKTQRYKFKTNINGNINDFDQYLRFRTFSFNIRYNFNKGLKTENKRRSANVEEVNRT